MSQENKNSTDHNFDENLFLPIEPIRLFDDYYYVGNRLVGFHILRTSEGLVLFDAADMAEADERYLIPGLKKLGLENEKINTLFLTHGHFDHTGGAEAVRRRAGCDVALSEKDTAYLLWCDENRGKDAPFPRITRLVKGGEEISFGDHTVTVLDGAGHTPGCLNYSFTVHEGEEEHRVIMVGGYGVFGPGSYPEHEYPYGVSWAVEQALTFASTCVSTWEYCKENHCDVYLNPHPHLCDLVENGEKNRARQDGAPNAFIIGTEGVRRWIAERFDVCMESVEKFTDIRREYEEK